MVTVPLLQIKDPNIRNLGKALTKFGYHSSGCELLYNGMTGEQLETEIYFGPTFYLRLKHMPKDKVNYRARGPRTVLTRQTVQGRANDGGLKYWRDGPRLFNSSWNECFYKRIYDGKRRPI